MADVVKSMDATLRSMNLEKVKKINKYIDVQIISFQSKFFSYDHISFCKFLP